MIITHPISTYLNEHLGVFLQSKDLNEETVTAVTNDVENRLTSLLSHWNDAKSRSPLLLTVLEEGTFYMPYHKEVNALVVLAVRNSDQIQHLHSELKLLDDSEIRTLTSQAIEYFATVDLAELARQAEQPAQDLFGSLPSRYPLAWEAFQQIALSTMKYQYVTYTPTATDLPDLPALESGVDSQILDDLTQIQNGEISFLFRDSFKWISRDTDHLLHVIELVLRANKTVITHNYYISNGTVAYRKPLMKPASKQSDIAKKFDNKKGLWNRHKDSLRLLKKYIVPAE